MHLVELNPFVTLAGAYDRRCTVAATKRGEVSYGRSIDAETIELFSQSSAARYVLVSTQCMRKI